MSPFHPLPLFGHHSTLILDDDVEMLQTDVMRFFAVLCLCLMAIFALVKTLPMAPPEKGPALVRPADRKAEAVMLQDKIAILKEKLEGMQIRLKASAAEAKRASTRFVEATQTEEAARDRVDVVNKELETVSRTLVDTRREIEMRELSLAKILKDIEDKRQVRAQLKSQIENETQRLTKIREKMQRMAEKLYRNQPSNQVIVKTPPQDAPPAEPVQRGFTLRFASDEILNKLISNGKVKFYAIAGKKAWRLNLSGQKPVYIAAEVPRQIYEMEIPTVPTNYAAVFQRQIAAFGRRTLTWGVTLPARTVDSIHQMITGRDGGELIITAGGEVKLN